MTAIVFGVPHAAWPMHQSGYPSHLEPQEYPIGKAVCVAAAELLAGQVDVDVLEMRERNGDKVYRCDPDSCPGRYSQHEKNKCRRYRNGLEDYVARSRDADLAVTFHIDRTPPGLEGPIVLTSGSEMANRWAMLWLGQVQMCRKYHQRAQVIDGGTFMGVLPYTDHRVRQRYHPNAWCQRGAHNAVLVELGVVGSAEDCAWLTDGPGVQQAAEAAARATVEVCGTDTVEEDEING